MTEKAGGVSQNGAPPERVVRRVAQKVRARREAMNLDQDLRLYDGPSRATVGTLENKGRWPLRARTRASWAKALGWQPDAFDRMVKGQEPLEIERASIADDAALRVAAAEVFSRIRDLAEEGASLLREEPEVQ